jgi:hypothetical protein
MLATVLAFIDAHPRAIPATLAAFVALGRAVAAKHGDAIKHRYPKLAAVAEGVAHLSPDLVKAATAILRAWKPGLLGVLTLMLVACASRPYSPAEDTLVAIHSTAHGLALADNLVAPHCGVASPAPDCQRFVDAYDGLRASLIVAERAASEWRRIGDAPSACAAREALRGARGDLDAVFALLASLHVAVPAEVESAARTLASIANSLAHQCTAGDASHD